MKRSIIGKCLCPAKNIFSRGAAAAEGSSVSCCAQARCALCGHDSSAVGEGRCCGFNIENCNLVLFRCGRLPLPFTTLFFSSFRGGPRISNEMYYNIQFSSHLVRWHHVPAAVLHRAAVGHLACAFRCFPSPPHPSALTLNPMKIEIRHILSI
jgi:hypothetical protein